MIDYSKLYDEYLYDCYVANQRLTEEDWRYYGKENHHIEIPNRDAGVLTPLNSQYLTTYQHWIAGVLQSEVLGKCCFAFIPAGILPSYLEALRVKWHATVAAEAGRIGGKTGDLSNRNRNVSLNRWAKLTLEERSEQAKKAWENFTPEERSTLAKQTWEVMTPDERANRCRGLNSGRTAEDRSAALRKGWETRRRKAQEN